MYEIKPVDEYKICICFDFVLVKIGDRNWLFRTKCNKVVVGDIVRCRTKNGIKEGTVVARCKVNERNQDIISLILGQANAKCLDDVKYVKAIVRLEEINYEKL